MAKNAQEKETGNNLVPIFIDPKFKGDDTQYVAINGRRWLIQKGRTVMVPPEVAELIRNAQRQERASDAYIDRVTGNM